MKNKAEQLQHHEDLYLTLDQLCQTAEVMGAVIERLKNYMAPLEKLEHPTQTSNTTNRIGSTQSRARKSVRTESSLNSALNLVH